MSTLDYNDKLLCKLSEFSSDTLERMKYSSNKSFIASNYSEFPYNVRKYCSTSDMGACNNYLKDKISVILAYRTNNGRKHGVDNGDCLII